MTLPLARDEASMLFGRTLSGPVLRLATETVVTRGLTTALRLARNVLLARLLGPFERGVVNALFALIETLTYVAGFGMTTAATRHAADGDEPDRGDVVVLAASAAVALLIGIATFAVLSTGWLLAEGAALLAPYAGLFAAMAFLMYARQVAHAQLVGTGRVGASNAFKVAEAVSLFVLVGAALLFAADRFEAVGLAFFAGYCLVATGMYAAVCRRGVTRGTGAGGLRRLLGRGLRSYPDDVAQIIVFRSDLLLIAALIGPEAAAYYAVALVGTDVIAMTTEALSTALQRDLVTSVAAARTSDRQAFMLARLTLYAAVPMAVALTATAPFWVGLLFGEDYLPAVAAVPWLAAGVAMASPFAFLRLSLIGRGYPGLVSLVGAVAAALNIALNLVLIPELGIVGAAIASLVTYTGVTAANAAHLARRTGLPIATFAWDPQMDRLAFRAIRRAVTRQTVRPPKEESV